MAEAPVTAPMEVDTTPEEEDEECLYPSRFNNKHKYTANGSPKSKSNMLNILSKMTQAKHKRVYASLPRSTSKKADALMKLLETDKALERDILDHRRKDVKQWNKERRAEDKAAAGVVDDGPVPYAETGSGLSVIAGAFRERLDLAAEARERFGDDLRGFTNLAQSLGQQLLASEAPEDIELIGKLLAHRKARYAAWRKAQSSADGRKGELTSTAPQTAVYDASKSADWSGAAGKKGTEALEEALDPLDETPPLSDTATWDAIAKTVSAAARRTYTGQQCHTRASSEGYLRAKLPDVEVYAPTIKDWTPRNMATVLRAAGLDQSIPCGKAALKADAFKGVSTSKLYERLGDAYNIGIHPLRGDRENIIAALVDADMCALDPREHGATGFKRAGSARFRRAFDDELLPRLNVLRSLEASEARLESPSDGDNLVRSTAAVYGRLSQQNLTCLCFKKFALEPHEAPSTRMAPLLNEYFFRPPYKPHVEYDAAQDCTCCRGLYEDNGFATCLEHAHDVQFGCCAIRNNGNKCNTSWIEFFDKLAREFKIETLREKRDVAVAANKRWGHLSPRRRAWKYD